MQGRDQTKEDFVKTVREHILDRITRERESILLSQHVIDNLLHLLVKLPLPLRAQEVVSGYDCFGGTNFSIRNNNDEVKGLGAKVATWLALENKVEVDHTGLEPSRGVNYYRFDLGDGFSLDVDCKYRPKCETVRVRHVVEETITLCGELPEGYERVEEKSDGN